MDSDHVQSHCRRTTVSSRGMSWPSLLCSSLGPYPRQLAGHIIKGIRDDSVQAEVGAVETAHTPCGFGLACLLLLLCSLLLPSSRRLHASSNGWGTTHTGGRAAPRTIGMIATPGSALAVQFATHSHRPLACTAMWLGPWSAPAQALPTTTGSPQLPTRTDTTPCVLVATNRAWGSAGLSARHMGIAAGRSSNFAVPRCVMEELSAR
jgi:hypothetical protein